MADSDLFAAPSKAELDDSAVFAPPSKEEMEAATPPREQGWLERTGRGAVNNLPTLGGIVGGVLGTPADVIAGPMGNIAGAAVGGAAGTATKNLINSYIDPDSAPQTMTGALVAPVKGAAQQGLMQATGEGIAAAAAPVLSKFSGPVYDYLRGVVNARGKAATGATGVQMSKMAPDAGTQLVDRGIVGFGNSQAQIAKNAAEALDASGQQIGDLLKQLDAQGVTVDRNTVIKYIKDKIASLAGNEGEKPLVKQLESKISDIEDQIPGSSTDFDAENAADAAPSSSVPIGKAEEIKRSFDKSGKWNSNSDAAMLEANRTAGDAYRGASEDAALAADPDLASQFQGAKDDYSLLKPVAAAAEKRAATTAQSPPGGFLDSATSAAGALVGGAPGAFVAPMARRVLAPRINSSAAVGANWLADAVKAAPTQFGKWAPALTQASQRGGNALGATDYILQQTDPDYRQHIMGLKNAQEEIADKQGDQ